MGLIDYFWPHPPGHHHRFRDEFASALVNETREMFKDGRRGSKGLSVLLHHLIIDAMSIFYSLSIVQGFSGLGKSVLPPSRSRVLSAIAEARIPPPPTIKQILVAGPERPKLLRLPLRISRDFLLTDQIIRRRFREPDFKTEIIAVKVFPLLEAHARSIGEQVTWRRPHIWFNKRPAPSVGTNVSQSVDMVISVMGNVLTRNGITVPDWLGKYVSSWLESAISHVEAYTDAIEYAGPHVPHRLWVGSNGDIWTRILSYAVRRSGGQVTAHDHGSGYGQFKNEVVYNFLEFDFCDHFVSFTKNQADGLRKNHINLKYLMRTNVPKITALTVKPKADKKKIFRTGRVQKTVMLLTGYYYNDRTPYRRFLSDVAYFDFEVRLLAHLRDWNYNVIYKPHPEMSTRPSENFARHFGAREENQPSEKVIREAEVLILVDPSSTAFATSLASGNPAVFVDFGLFSHTDIARAALSKRCVIVPAPCGPDQRVTIDWNAMHCAIAEASPSVDEEEYVQLFHANID